MLLLAGQLLAQNRIITGTVTDDKGTPSNVSVQVKGTATGTLTKDNSAYSYQCLLVHEPLVFSSINMEPKELTISNLAVVNSTVVSTEKAMEEVIVTGYQTVRKRDVTAAISKISAEEIDNLPIPNFAQAMQGRAAGVIVAAANAIPGGF